MPSSLVDPDWDPGVRWATGGLAEAFAASFTRATSLETLLTRPVSAYDGTVPRTAKARPIGRAQLEAAADVVANGQLLSSIISRSDQVDASLARDVAGVLRCPLAPRSRPRAWRSPPPGSAVPGPSWPRSRSRHRRR